MNSSSFVEFRHPTSELCLSKICFPSLLRWPQVLSLIFWGCNWTWTLNAALWDDTKPLTSIYVVMCVTRLCNLLFKLYIIILGKGLPMLCICLRNYKFLRKTLIPPMWINSYIPLYMHSSFLEILEMECNSSLEYWNFIQCQ